METIVKYAQGLVYSLICLMPSTYQKASLKVMLGMFLEALGHPLPQHTELKSASALSRFLNHYEWSTRGVIRATRQAILQQISQRCPRETRPMGACTQRQTRTTYRGSVFGDWRMAHPLEFSGVARQRTPKYEQI